MILCLCGRVIVPIDGFCHFVSGDEMFMHQQWPDLEFRLRVVSLCRSIGPRGGVPLPLLLCISAARRQRDLSRSASRTGAGYPYGKGICVIRRRGEIRAPRGWAAGIADGVEVVCEYG